MHRRPIGRGRTLAALAAIALVVGCLLPWWQLGGQDLPAVGGNAFQGAGIVVFAIPLATLALITLPYATDQPVTIDRWPAFVLLVGVGGMAFAVRLIELIGAGAFRDGFLPDRAPGLWISAVALIVLGRAAYVIAQERIER
jgi:hypothetical protein